MDERLIAAETIMQRQVMSDIRYPKLPQWTSPSDCGPVVM